MRGILWILASLMVASVATDVGAKGTTATSAEIDAFLSAHWQDPPAANTAAAEGWGPLELSLEPEKCATCHAPQYEAWKESRHAIAVSPGLEVQSRANPQGFDSCYTCHAPLREQRKAPGGAPQNPEYRPELAEHGVMCASCHVRDGKVYGPPPRDPERSAKGTPGLPHGGFEVSQAYTRSAFCATCHQFSENGFRIEGVLLENTHNEWRESRYAEAGVQCQDCHMPDRKHAFKGIHDPEMTASGLDVTLTREGSREVRFAVTNSGVGHRFPTYVTPRVTVVLEGRSDGEVVKRAEHVIQRRITLDLQTQEFDTRLAPDETAEVVLSWWFWTSIDEVVGYVYVEPDEFYHRFFRNFTPAGPELMPLLEQAQAETSESPFRILERRMVFD